MEYTKEEIAKASAMLSKAKGVTAVANDIKRSSTFSYLKARYKDLSVWEMRRNIRTYIANEILGEENESICFESRYETTAEALRLNLAYRKYLEPITDEVWDAIKRTEREYSLKSEFGSLIKMTGSSRGVRLVKNSPIKNTYAVMFDGSVGLGVAYSDEVPEKLGDIGLLFYYDTLKELSMSLDHELNRHRELCQVEINTLAERGGLNDKYVVSKRWFVPDEEVNDMLKKAMQDISEQTFSVVQQGSSLLVFRMFVKKDAEVTEKDNVVKSGLKYDVAQAVANATNEVSYKMSCLESESKRIEVTREKLSSMEREFVEVKRSLAEKEQKLSDILHNNNISSDVIKVNQFTES